MSRPPSPVPYAVATARLREIDAELTSLYARARHLLAERAAVIASSLPETPPPGTPVPAGIGAAPPGHPATGAWRLGSSGAGGSGAGAFGGAGAEGGADLPVG